MTGRQIASLLIILAVLVLQFGVPAMQLFSDGSNRWGWQMYSRAPERPAVLGVSADGATQPVQISRYMHQFRYELDYGEHFFEQLCVRLPGADSFQVEYRLSGETATFECRD